MNEHDKALLEFAAEQERCKALTPRDQYRVYHKDGQTIQFALGPPWPELDADYIDITEKQVHECAGHPHKIENGKLIKIDTSSRVVLKLSEDAQGEYTATEYMSIIVEPGEEYDNIKKYTISGCS